MYYSFIPSLAFTNGLSVFSNSKTSGIYLGFNNIN